MGCASSTEVSSDPITGQQKTTNKLGGTYPGNRRTPQPQHNLAGQPDGHVQHFINYGGGNALVLQQGGIAQTGYGGQKQPQYIQVTLPDGVDSGQTIHVQAPDGQLNEIIVPAGFGPGSTFTVEFADVAGSHGQTFESATTGYEKTNTQLPSSQAEPQNAYAATQDDGFASGFGGRTPAPMANASYANDDSSSYPVASSDARPIYAAPPSYSSKPF